jgi:hypothetical protein
VLTSIVPVLETGYVSVIRWKDGEALIWVDIVTRAIHSYLAAILELFKHSINLIICGDFNINYLVNTNTKLQLDSLLLSYDLYNTVDFPTRISNYSSTAIDNIFIDKFKNVNFTIKPLPNGLSDHDAQILILHDIKIQNLETYHYTKKLINDFTISEFQLNLSCESWDEIFTEETVDSVFNSFLNTYLRIFYHSFLLKKVYHSHLNKAWVTSGIKISSQHKRDLYLLYRSSNNPKLKNHYKTYCRILSDVIKTVKKLYYNKLITKSNNKTKVLWNIVKMTQKKQSNDNGPPLNIDGKTHHDYQSIANIFNNYFTNMTDKVSENNPVNMNLALNSLYKAFI